MPSKVKSRSILQKEKLNINATHGISKMQHVRNVLGRTPEWLINFLYRRIYWFLYCLYYDELVVRSTRDWLDNVWSMWSDLFIGCR